MENNNEIIENSDEVMETATEEIVKAASSNSSFSTATKLGLAMIAGGLICKFVVEPGVAKLKRMAEERAAKKSASNPNNVVDADYEEVPNDDAQEK